MIRNILGGFLFSGDDVEKKAGVLSGGERTRLAVARMLLTPANTLLLDEPTNHLDLDSKDVLLEALEDFGGTLIFVSHDRYFVDKLATKIIEVGHGGIEIYPGTYAEFLWSRAQRAQRGHEGREAGDKRGNAKDTKKEPAQAPNAAASARSAPPKPKTDQNYEDKKRADVEARKRRRDVEIRGRRLAELEARIAEREQTVKTLEAQMAEPAFYDQRAAAEETIKRHQQLMWEVGDLMNQWEALQSELAVD
jgi:ATP-binding cassette subfamily F protein 3